MPHPTFASVYRRASGSLVRFRDDESGSTTLILIFMFLIMMMFGGIAVDVMRFEVRRVALQQTLDRAALAAASLQQTRTPQEIVDDWFEKSGLANDNLDFVDFSDPTVTAISDAGLRRVTVDAEVISKNFFMSWYSPRDTLEGPALSQAAQGVSKIEVILVVDITGSMGENGGGGMTKIQGLRQAATAFVDLVKDNDTNNQVSIGMVPFAAQVNIPVNLRQQFNVLNLSSWNNVPNAGVPNKNCVEFPTSGFTSTAVSLTTPLRMAAVADGVSTSSTGTGYQSPQGPTNVPCTDNTGNLVLMPTKNGTTVKNRIAQLNAAGNTYTVVGMRWGTALLDQAARPIYTAIGGSDVQGRPADNDAIDTRKIIILMTDGDHVTNTHILDAYKTGLSPIWRGTDNRFAIRYTTGGPASTGGARPSCAGSNTYFIPHLQTGTTCMAAAWSSTPSWSGSGTVTQLDWSEVWRYARVSWVVRQLYMRSNVGGTNNYDTLMNQFRTTYLSSTTNMDTLLQRNCSAARDAGMEIYGIAFGATISTNGATQIRNCSSLPQENYYYRATDNARLLAAFQQIATDISDLRLTQ